MQKQTENNNNDIVDAIYDIDKTLSTTADGTNWTVADSVSNINFELQEMNVHLKELIKILKDKS